MLGTRPTPQNQTVSLLSLHRLFQEEEEEEEEAKDFKKKTVRL